MYLLSHPHLDYATWKAFNKLLSVRLLTSLVLLSLVLHAWIGIWTVTTDYLQRIGMRLFVQVVVALALIVYLIWGVTILWGSA